MNDDNQAEVIASQSKASMGGDRGDAVIAAIVSTLIFGSLLLSIFLYEVAAPNPRLFLFLSGTIGAALGWATGILLSPYNSRETGLFEKVGGTVTGLISGYIAAKLEPVVTTWVTHTKDQGVPIEHQLVFGVMLATFVTACSLTYISRRYWL